LFPLPDGGALLITTVKYAPASGKPFIEESVTPTVKVERPVSTEAVAPESDDDAEPNDDKPETAPTPAKPEPTPAAPAEATMLKKSIQLLKQAPSKAPAAQKRAAVRSFERRAPGAVPFELRHAA